MKREVTFLGSVGLSPDYLLSEDLYSSKFNWSSPYFRARVSILSHR
jgi:hypothetical protein